jgi:hypothetical protein
MMDLPVARPALKLICRRWSISRHPRFFRKHLIESLDNYTWPNIEPLYLLAPLGTEVAQMSYQQRRKEVSTMKIATSLFAGLLLIGTMGSMTTAMAQDNPAKAADGVIEKEPLNTTSYCHLKFPAINPDTLGTNHPALESANSGDIIDFYGPCDENPLGKDQQTEQKLNQERHWRDVDSGY